MQAPRRTTAEPVKPRCTALAHRAPNRQQSPMLVFDRPRTLETAMLKPYYVHIQWDAEAQVWVASSDVVSSQGVVLQT